MFDFFIQWIRFGREGDEYSEMLMMFICVVLLMCDFFYFGWMYLANLQMPPQWGISSHRVLFGYSAQARQHLNAEIHIAKGKLKDSKQKAGKGLKTIAGLRKAKRGELAKDSAAKVPTLTREVELQGKDDDQN